MHPANCPHCNKPSFGFWSKVSLGPVHQKACPDCGKMVRVPWLQSSIHLLAIGLIPLLFCLLTISLFDSSNWLSLAIPAIGVIAGTAIEMWIYYRFVPLQVGAA